jgi:Tol biopolymer transport system component
MPLAPGTRLGPYEITGPLGAGGMGEVYRARDTRLGRDVAVKVLPGHRSSSAEVRSRFEREARTVSSLNHPHICTLHDVGREGDTDYLVMELIEGETLGTRLARGALPIAEVLKLGAQIADALDRAHRAGVVHRDLKPGNVMLTKSGAKLMDFGLARVTGLAGPPGSGVSAAALTQSPTMAQPLTAEGTIVGTFQYMAPEQLEGKEADARSDLWALGCVLYEMATGRRAFAGASQASLIGAIMNVEPAPISQNAPLTPPALDRVIHACLAKDPDERIQTAHDVKLQLQWVAGEGSQAGVAVPLAARSRPGRERIAWGVAAVFAALAVLAIFPWPGRRETLRPIHVSVPPPENVIIDDELLHTTVSPDGGAIVFVGTDTSGQSQLWVRDLDATEARPLPGTEGAILPFWSPDSRTIGFFAAGKLRKIEAAGRNVQILCEAPDGRGAAWSRRGVILFAPSSAGPLYRVAEAGGRPTQALALDTARAEGAQRFPSFLPDGRRFFYVSLASGDTAQTRLGSLDSPATNPVVTADAGAIYAAPGYVIYSRNEALLAQRFANGCVTGEPRAMGSDPTDASRYNGRPPASVSTNGVLVQRRRTPRNSRLAWLDREGRRVAIVPGAPAHYQGFALSPSDDRAACIRATGTTQDVWVVELTDGLASRLTSDRKFPESPIWTPDGRWITFASSGEGGRDLCRTLASGAGEAEVVERLEGAFDNPAAWTPDGHTLLLRILDPKTGEDVWAVPAAGDAKRFPVLRGSFHEENPQVSPDGRWIAYRSDESGRTELYVQSFPRPDAKYRVSKEGAGPGTRSNFGRPFWRRDGRELLFVAGDGVTMMSASVEIGATFRAGTPRALFRIPSECSGVEVTSDARRFLVLEDVSTSESASIQMVLHWPAKLEKP